MEGGGGGSGSGINSVVEAEIRARELGAPRQPDAAHEEAEAKSQRAMLVIGALAVVGLTWLFAGIAYAAIAFGVIAAVIAAAWWLRSR